MSLTAFGIYNGYAPEGGPKGMPVRLDFSSVSEIKFDLLLEQTEGQQDFVQGVYVDNTDNPNPLVFTFGITNQRIVVPANSQGTYPVLAPDQVTVKVTTTPGANVICQAIFLNVPTAYTQWGPISVNVNSITVSPTPLIANTVDRSGTIAAGGTPQTLMATNASRRRMYIENRADQVGVVVVTFASGAKLSILPGTWFDSESGPVSGEALTISATDTGHAFNAWEQ